MIELILAILALLSQGGDPIVTWVAPAPPAVAYQTEAVVTPDPCDLVVSYDWDADGQPFETGRVVNGVGVRADIIGTYLQFQVDGSELSSVELTPDTSTVEVCRG